MRRAEKRKSFVAYKRESYERDFAAKAEMFQSIMAHGGGLTSPFVLETLRDLHMLYLLIAAHREVERSAARVGTL